MEEMSMEKTNCFDICLVEEANGKNTAVRAPYLVGREGMFVCYVANGIPKVGMIRKRIPSYKHDVLTQILFSVSKVHDAYMVFEPSWVIEEATI
jgi:hypothetical protein